MSGISQWCQGLYINTPRAPEGPTCIYPSLCNKLFVKCAVGAIFEILGT